MPHRTIRRSSPCLLAAPGLCETWCSAASCKPRQLLPVERNATTVPWRQPITGSRHLAPAKLAVAPATSCNDAVEVAIALIGARPASNPSFWIRHVEFVRTYSKVGSLWLPSRDEMVADIRIYGRKVLK